MIFVKIPFKDKKNGYPLVIYLRGGHHPYHQLNVLNDRFDLIEEHIKLKSWDYKKDLLVPEWVAEIRISYGKLHQRMSCEGRDVYIEGKQPIQRMIHRKGDRAINV